MTTLTFDLPDNLIKEAKSAGLLTPEVIEAMLRENLRRCQALHRAGQWITGGR